VISKRVAQRKDGRSSAGDALRYGEGLTRDRTTGELLDKSRRTRLSGFGLVDDGVYADRGPGEMSELIELAAIEMQANCDRNTRVGPDKKLAHFVVSFAQDKPSEAVLRDTEDSMLAEMKLSNHHFATFLHSDNGYWHLHIFASRIEKGPPHRGNPLWHDKIKRDRVCREIEIRHSLARDNGLHRVDDDGQVVEVPKLERIARREAKSGGISDRAKTTEIYSGGKSFQSWAFEIRIGDRLKHATTWQDLHASAAAYGCEIKPKSGGFVICPLGEKGGIQLSKLGLKKLSEKFGQFVPPPSGQTMQAAQPSYEPAPTQEHSAGHYKRWQAEKATFAPHRTTAINKLREGHKTLRADLREEQKAELNQIRASTKGSVRHSAISIAKMEHALALTALTARFAVERKALRTHLGAEGPGNTFRDYLVAEAIKGDNAALGLARKYGVEESTDVLRQREAAQIKIVAAVMGREYRPATRMPATHVVQRNGTVVYDLGLGRSITDSAIAKQVQLNGAAASSPDAVALALRFSASKFGSTLTLTGSPQFQRMAVEIAVRDGLPIKFADPTLDAYRAKLVAELQARKPSPRQPKEKSHAPNHYRQQAICRPPAHRRDRLHYLSDGDVVLNLDRPIGVLLENVPGRVELAQEGSNHGMQRARGGDRGAPRTGSTVQDLGQRGNGKAGADTGIQRPERDSIIRTSAPGRDGTGRATQRSDVPVALPIQPLRVAESAAGQAVAHSQQNVLQQKNLPSNLLQPDLAPLPSTPIGAAKFSAAPMPDEKDPMVTATQEHDLVLQATAKRDADPRYQPTQDELATIDQVLIEQAKARLDFDKKWQALAEANSTQIRHGTVIEVCGDRAIYKSGREHFVGPAPTTKGQGTGPSKGRGD
jgi:hypothetical protein